MDVRVFNRLGKEIYSNPKYDNSWAGDYQGQVLQDGTYYYVIKLGDTDDILKGAKNIMR